MGCTLDMLVCLRVGSGAPLVLFISEKETLSLTGTIAVARCGFVHRVLPMVTAAERTERERLFEIRYDARYDAGAVEVGGPGLEVKVH